MEKQFITDAEGNKIAGIIPIKEYYEMTVKLENAEISIVSENSEIYERTSNLTQEQEDELKNRYEYVLKNPTLGKSWDEIKDNLMSQ